MTRTHEYGAYIIEAMETNRPIRINGNIPNARHSQLVSPLYRSFRTVDLLSGAKGDPLDVANEKIVLTTKEKLVGIGLAQGNHPVLGPNTVYVALVFGTKK